MAKAKTVVQTPTFKRAVKKLKPAHKKELDAAVKVLKEKPSHGEQKKGDLTFLRLYKFKINRQFMLLGYSFDKENLTLELLALGSHENVYRDAKRKL